MSDLTFLPWLRRGLSAKLDEADVGQTEFARSAPVDVRVEVDGSPAEGRVQLRPADHVTGIDLTQVARRYPAPNANQVETGYWPVIEFTAADLPWTMTPLAPDPATGRLRPWLVLVCMPDADATFSAGLWGVPSTLTVDGALLGDLTESHTWAHVQSIVAAEQVVANAGTSSVVSRLVAPTTLVGQTTYRVALVPAFAVIDDTTVGPAWSGAGPVTLTVFDTWTFTTGLASTFEELVGLLGPVPPDADLDLGIRAVDITDLGAADPWPDDAPQKMVDYAGALIDTDLTPAGLNDTDRDAFRLTVSDLLNQGDARVEVDSDEDPVVTPPCYGAYAADDHHVEPDDAGWQAQANLIPRQRMAAGLGAETVRRNQGRYMAQAWAQAGEVQELRRTLNTSRLQAEIGRTWKRRTSILDDGDEVAVLRPQYSTVRDDDGRAPRAELAHSGIPNGLFDPVLARVMRPGSVASRAMGRRNPEVRGDEKPAPASTPRVSLTSRLGNPVARDRIGFGRVDAPRGTQMSGARDVGPIAVAEGAPDPTHRTGASRFDDAHPDALRLDVVAASARAQVQPMVSTRARTVARVRGLRDHLDRNEFPDDEIPVRIKIGPKIDEALMWALLERSSELVLPGAGEFPNNSVRMVEANPGFVAAFLAGANHEMSRELLWREYPADMGSTTFHRFWDRAPDQRDVADIADWPEQDSLTTVGTAGGESVVVLARGDVFALYPTMQILLRDPGGVLQPPSFGGAMAPNTRFFAFDVESADEVYAGGWFVRFQEQPTEPRFGLDDDVTVDPTSAATFASTTYQAPFAQEFAVEDIIGEGSA